MFQDNKYPIAYEIATSSNHVDDIENLVPILLLNGFGVGSFHQHRLMRQILLQQDKQQQNNNEQKTQQQYVIYGIDYLGQGKSWPTNCNDGNSENELNLGYSADTWLEQLHGFIEEIVLPNINSSSDNTSTEKKVHLVGNSVGGYLSTILTSRYPHLVSSLTLLNATPVWGLNLPGWDGRLPAPPIPKFIGRVLFDTIRDVNVIDKYLDNAYVHRSAFDGTFDDSFYDGCDSKGGEALGVKIKACTETDGGHAAFASILFSPPASELKNEEEVCPQTLPPTPADFYATLGKLPVDVLLLFGENDPWCTPAVAKRMHTTLASRDSDGDIPETVAQRYISLLNVGHCPNHEAPTMVARVLLSWIGSDDRCNASLISSNSNENVVCEPWGDVSAREVSIEESNDLGIVDRIVSTLAS